MAENVKVAVRVRPFNKREKDRNATVVVKMDGSTTTLTNPDKPNDKPKKFTFDYSYWSHDGYKERADGYLEKDKASSKYCDQNRVFDDLGQGILNNAWEGYNSTLFAYGQTGSGKSYSIVGYGINKGVVPVLADRLFTQIGEKSNGADGQFEVTFSMLEIYSEQVRDLLNPKTLKLKGGLKVRENPTRGFYVEGLETVAVASYENIESRMSEGTKNRTVAATNMNATSSRAHTIVGITFVQKTKNDSGEEMSKTSVINLVDLAGSERARSTGATGERLKEGAMINQSLSSLGNVISALADRSGGKKVRVPYRDSALTKLLKNALGGNSKTVMVAAISPADINYDETLSTLRYADRAKQIKTVAKVNEDPTAKLIRELQEENKKLKELIEKGGAAAVAATVDGDSEELTEAEKEQIKREYEELMQAAMSENERKMKDMEQSWQEKLELAAKEHDSTARKELEAKMETTPHIFNLNADPQMCKVLVHILEKGQEYMIGKPADNTKIPLQGAGIMDQHAIIRGDGGNIFLKIIDPEAKVRFNGELLLEGDEMQLRQNDRILFGTSHLYVYCDPVQYKAAPQNYPEVSYEMAQDEISACIGLSSAAEKSKAEAEIREQLAELRPAVDEANSISEELDQKVKFDVLVVPPHYRGIDTGMTEIMVRMKHLENGMSWVWSREKFINRKYIMQEMYEEREEGQATAHEENPFTEDANTDILIGSAAVSPQCLAYMIDMSQQFPLLGYAGDSVGVINGSLVPCDSKGKEITDDDNAEFIDDPKELIGRKYKVKVKIDNARGLPKRFKDVYVKYDMFLETDNKTKVINGTANPDFNYSGTHQFNPATSELVNWLKTGNLILQVRGKQQPEVTGNRRKMTTRQLSKTSSLVQAASQIQQNQSAWKTVTIDKLAKGVLERRCDTLERKLHQLRLLVNKAEEQKIVNIRVTDLKKVLAIQQPEAIDTMIRKLAKEQAKGGDNPQSKACHLM
ncbi:kinesin-like protein KIF28 [Styela clava]